MSPRTVCILALSAVVLASCGASSPSGRSAFVSAADSTCKRQTAELTQLPIHTAAAILTNGPKAIAVEQRFGSELAALKPPSELRADWQTFLGDYRAVTADFQMVVSDVHAHHYDAAQRAENAGALLARTIHQLAARNGLLACSQI